MKVCCRILIRSGGDIGVDMRRRLAKHAVVVGVYVKSYHMYHTLFDSVYTQVSPPKTGALDQNYKLGVIGVLASDGHMTCVGSAI